MSYNLDWKGNNAHVTFTGDTDFDEIIEVSNIIIGDARFNTMDYAIYNYLDTNNYNLTEEDIEVMAVLNKNASVWNQNIRLALVDNDSFIEKMLIEYMKLMGNKVNWKIKRFSSLKESIEWCEA